MANHSNINKSNSAKPTQQSTKVGSAVAAKVDNQTALEFSRLLQQRSEGEHSLIQKKEIDASVDEGVANAEARQLSADNASKVPDMFFQSGHNHARSSIQEATEDGPKAIGGTSAGMPTSEVSTPVAMQSEQSRPVVIDQIVETVYRDWQSQQASMTGQKWSFQINTGTNVTSELEIELTSSGEWQLRISDDSKSGAANSDGDGEDQLAQSWDHRQFCIELEACLRKNRPEISFSASGPS